MPAPVWVTYLGRLLRPGGNRLYVRLHQNRYQLFRIDPNKSERIMADGKTLERCTMQYVLKYTNWVQQAEKPDWMRRHGKKKNG